MIRSIKPACRQAGIRNWTFENKLLRGEMLVSSKEIIFRARANRYTIGCFNTSDLEITKAIIAGAEAQKAPVLVSTSPKAIEYAGAEMLSSMIKEAAQKAKVPVALHLDHGLTISLVEECLELGYTSIMFDGSGSSFDDNAVLTRQAVEMAHAKSVPCEGELGHLGKSGPSTSLGVNKTKGTLTNPEDVVGFIQQTGVDFLAVSIGSAHGVGGNEKLDLPLLKKIASKTGIPLVLHGASGISDKDIKAAIESGISKINIDTDIRHTFVHGLRDYLDKNPKEKDPREILSQVMLEIQKYVEGKIKLFGSDGKV